MSNQSLPRIVCLLPYRGEMTTQGKLDTSTLRARVRHSTQNMVCGSLMLDYGREIPYVNIFYDTTRKNDMVYVDMFSLDEKALRITADWFVKTARAGFS